MMKKLFVPLFALGIAVYGCGSNTTKKKDGGAAGGSGGTSAGGSGGTGGAGGRAGSGGSGGSAGSGGSGGSSMGGSAGSNAGGAGGARDAGAGGSGGSAGAGGAGGAKADASADTTVARDSAGDSAGGKPAFCTKPMGVDAATFCAAYMSTCGFGGTGQYKDLADCTMSYNGATSDKDCRALHVCNAAGYAKNSADWTAHCGHAIGGNAVCK